MLCVTPTASMNQIQVLSSPHRMGHCDQQSGFFFILSILLILSKNRTPCLPNKKNVSFPLGKPPPSVLERNRNDKLKPFAELKEEPEIFNHLEQLFEKEKS